MIKLYNLLVLVPFLIIGCKTRHIDYKINSQLIDSFNMDIFSKTGEKIISIKSPKSSYNKDINTFNLTKSTIYLFKKNIKQYIILSDEAMLSNNNNLVELNGNVFVNNLLKKYEKLYTNNFQWNVNNSEYILKGNVIFENKTIKLSSNKAIMNNSDNIIKFFNPVKYIIKGENNENKYEINSENAFYNLNTESVSFEAKDKRVKSIIYF